MKWTSLPCLLCALTLGCDSSSGEGTRSQNLQGTKWKLVAWSIASSNPEHYMITANFNEGQISGRSAVNSYGGAYTTTSDFSLGEIF